MSYFYRGIAYAKISKYKEAITDLTNYISIEPSNAEAYAQLAFARMQQNSQEQVSVDTAIICTDFQQAVKLGDRSVEVRNAMKALCK
jgi:tetratricopeptide (TPR) repeat protein